MIGAIIGAAGGVLSSIFNSGAQKDANRANLQAVRETNAQNLQIYKDQLRYNAPIQQMSRLREAGLNPMLMYGQGNVGNATSMPQMQAAKFNPVQFDASPITNLAQNIANLKLTDSQSKVNDSVVSKNNQDVIFKMLQNKYAERNMLLDQLNKVQKMGVNSKYQDFLDKQIQKTDQDIKRLSTENEYLPDYLNTRNKLLDNKLDWSKYLYENRYLYTEKMRAVIDNLRASTDGKQLENKFARMTINDRHQLYLQTLNILVKKNIISQEEARIKMNEADFSSVKNFLYIFNSLFDKVTGFLK